VWGHKDWSFSHLLTNWVFSEILFPETNTVIQQFGSKGKPNAWKETIKSPESKCKSKSKS
jgi:glutathione peroxidase-family protein